MDASQFAVRQGIPLVDTFHISRGKVDDHFLDAIVENFNRRVKETGDFPVLKVTHGGEEVVGYARALRKQPLGNSGRNAVFGDLWLYKEKEDLFKTHPRRSAEIWINQKQLDAVALLGGTAPERDLGLSLSKDSDTKLLLSCPNMDQPIPTGDGMPMWMASLPDMIANKVAAAVAQALVTSGQPANPVPALPVQPPAPAAPEGEMSPDELEALIAELEGGEEPKEKEEPEEKEDMKLSKEVAELKAQIAERDTRDKLMSLSRDGYKIDVEAEVKVLMGVDPDTRKILLARIETNYPKAPVSGKPLEGLAEAKVPEVIDLSKDPATRKKVQEKLQLEREKNPKYSYEKAYFEVTGQELK